MLSRSLFISGVPHWHCLLKTTAALSSLWKTKSPWRLITRNVFHFWKKNPIKDVGCSSYTDDLIVFLVLLWKNTLESFFPPPLPSWASSSQRWSRSSSKAASRRLCWHNQDVSSQRDAGVSGRDTEGCRSCSNNSCTHTHTHTSICSICSSLFITSHLHVRISWQEVEGQRKEWETEKCGEPKNKKRWRNGYF